MRRSLFPICLMAVAAVASAPARAQSAVGVQAPAGYAPVQAPCVVQPTGSCLTVSAATPLPVAEKQESTQVASANVAAAPVAIYGGAYVFAQGCAGYNGGTLVLRYRGPDGATVLPLASKGASDTAGGTLVSLGSGAVIDVTLPAGSTGCNASLSRVP